MYNVNYYLKVPNWIINTSGFDVDVTVNREHTKCSLQCQISSWQKINYACRFYILLTEHVGVILVNNQLDAQFFFHHNHHVQEGLGLIPVPCILKMKLVHPSLPWSSYVTSSFGLYCSACLAILFVSILCMCCSHFSWYCFISFTIFSAPVFSLIKWFFLYLVLFSFSYMFYFYSLHVSGIYVPIIRRINCINMTSVICHSV